MRPVTPCCARLAELEKQRTRLREVEAELEKKRQLILDYFEGLECLQSCDSYGHDDLCPVASPGDAMRAMRKLLLEAQEAMDEAIGEMNYDQAAGVGALCAMSIFRIGKFLGNLEDLVEDEDDD